MKAKWKQMNLIILWGRGVTVENYFKTLKYDSACMEIYSHGGEKTVKIHEFQKLHVRKQENY